MAAQLRAMGMPGGAASHKEEMQREFHLVVIGRFIKEMQTP